MTAARSALEQRLAGAPWLLGIGHGPGGILVVTTATAHPAVLQAIGSHSMGVPVVAQVVPVHGAVSAPARVCPTCGQLIEDEGYVRSPEASYLPLSYAPMSYASDAYQAAQTADAAAMESTAYVLPESQAAMTAGTTGQATKSTMHPVFYVMAAASVAGVLLELARYLDSRKSR